MSIAATISKSFYKRPLPSTCTSFSSELGKSLFKKAITTPYMNGYFNLANNFLTQSEPAYCGLSALAMVLNSLEVDPQKRWKGGWRWYSEEMLDCCTPLEKVLKQGITFDEFSCLAACNGLTVKKYQADKTNKTEFIQAIKESCSSENKIVVVSFSRPSLQQTGDGHFSPIGGFEPESNMALVLDVARYKYPSYWVPLDALWDSLLPIDSETGRPRGFFILQKSSLASFGLLKVVMDPDSWSKFLSNGLCQDLTEELKLETTSVEQILPIIFNKFYEPMNCLEIRQQLEEDEEIEHAFFEETHQLLHEASHHPVYPLVKKAMEKSELLKNNPSAKKLQNKMHCHLKKQALNCVGDKDIDVAAALTTIFFLSIPRYFFNPLSQKAQKEVDHYLGKELLGGTLKQEIDRITYQLITMTEFDKNDSCKRCSQTCGTCSSNPK